MRSKVTDIRDFLTDAKIFKMKVCAFLRELVVPFKLRRFVCTPFLCSSTVISNKVGTC